MYVISTGNLVYWSNYHSFTKMFSCYKHFCGILLKYLSQLNPMNMFGHVIRVSSQNFHDRQNNQFPNAMYENITILSTFFYRVLLGNFVEEIVYKINL